MRSSSSFRDRSGRDAGGPTAEAAVGSDGRSLRSRRRSAVRTGVVRGSRSTRNRRRINSRRSAHSNRVRNRPGSGGSLGGNSGARVRNFDRSSESTRTHSVGPARARHTPVPSRVSRRSVRPGSTHRGGIGPTGRRSSSSRSSRRTGSAGPNASPSSRTRSRDFSVRRRMLGRQDVPPVAGRSSSANRVSTKESSSARVRSFRRTPQSAGPRQVRNRQANRARSSSRTYQRSRSSSYSSRGSNRARGHQSAGRSTARRPARSYSSPCRSSPPAARSRNRGGGSRSRSYSGRGRGSSYRGDCRARRNLGRR